MKFLWVGQLLILGLIGAKSNSQSLTRSDLQGYLVAKINIPGPYFVFEMNLKPDGTFTYQDANIESVSDLDACKGEYTFRKSVLDAKVSCLVPNPDDPRGEKDRVIRRFVVDFSQTTLEQLKTRDGVNLNINMTLNKLGPQIQEKIPFTFYKRKKSSF